MAAQGSAVMVEVEALDRVLLGKEDRDSYEPRKYSAILLRNSGVMMPTADFCRIDNGS